MATIRRDGRPVIGFGETGELSAPQGDRHDRPAPMQTSTPWVEVIASSVVGAVSGWVLEEVARRFGRKR